MNASPRSRSWAARWLVLFAFGGCENSARARASNPATVEVPEVSEMELADAPGDSGVPEAERPPFEAASAPDYFEGTWNGEYHGTQAFSTLYVQPGGTFTASVTAGPSHRCSAQGKLWFSDGLFQMEFDYNDCESSDDTALITRRVLYASENEFQVADEKLLSAVQRLPDGGVFGPVWTYRRQTRED